MKTPRRTLFYQDEGFDPFHPSPVGDTGTFADVSGDKGSATSALPFCFYGRVADKPGYRPSAFTGNPSQGPMVTSDRLTYRR